MQKQPLTGSNFPSWEPQNTNYRGDSYRYGFNGKENDNEVQGTGNQQDYGFRIYDPRLGKFLSVDPLSKEYPWNSTYAFAENDVIRCVDLDGEEKRVGIYQTHKDGKVIISSYRIFAFVDEQGSQVNGPMGDGTLTVLHNYSNNSTSYYYSFINPNTNQVEQVYFGTFYGGADVSRFSSFIKAIRRLDNLPPNDEESIGNGKSRPASAFEKWVLNNTSQEGMKSLREAFGNNCSNGESENTVTDDSDVTYAIRAEKSTKTDTFVTYQGVAYSSKVGSETTAYDTTKAGEGPPTYGTQWIETGQFTVERTKESTKDKR